jgi:hypothetical protein
MAGANSGGARRNRAATAEATRIAREGIRVRVRTREGEREHYKKSAII